MNSNKDALILCGGYGSRMGDLTKNLPKPMLRVGGKPILEHTINRLKKQNFTNFHINLHYFPEIISDYFGDGSNFNINISYYQEETLFGSGGTTRHVFESNSSIQNLLVVYGDVITNQNFSSLYEQLEKSRSVVTILVHQRKKSNSIVLLNENNVVTKFIERAKVYDFKNLHNYYINSGIQLINRRCMQYFPSTKKFDLPSDIYPFLTGKRLISAVVLNGHRFSIDSIGRLKEANEFYENSK